LSSNIGKLITARFHPTRQFTESIGETVISRAGDFFAIPFAAFAAANRWRAEGGAS